MVPRCSSRDRLCQARRWAFESRMPSLGSLNHSLAQELTKLALVPRASHRGERAMAMYKGKKVSVVRVARDGDKSFVAGSSEQVLIRHEDGKEEAVPKAEVRDAD